MVLLTLEVPFIIFAIKSFFLLFFLILLSFYDIKKGIIPNKILLLMLIIGLILNFILDFENFLRAIVYSLIFFIISFIFWELALINPGDVKLISLLPLFFVYNTKVEEITVFIFYLTVVFMVYLVFNIFKKIKTKKLKKKELKDSIIRNFKNYNIFLFFLSVFSLFTIFSFLNLNLWLSFILIFVFIVFTNQLKVEERKIIYFLVFAISILIFLKNEYYSNIGFFKNLVIIGLWLFILRYFLFVILFYYSITYKKVEELKIGDKLAQIPIKVGEKYGLLDLQPFDLFSFYRIKEMAFDNYNPSIGLEKENINKIKKFFKLNNIKKIKVFEEIPFVPFLLVSFILTFFSFLFII